MARIPSVHRELVTLSCTPQALTCSWIVPSKNQTPPYTLKAHSHTELDATHIHEGILINTSFIARSITGFLRDHNLEHAFVALSLAGPGVEEQWLTLKDNTQPTHPTHQKPEAATVWHSHDVYQTEDNAHVWYCCGIRQSLLLQWQLLALQNHINLITISSITMALLNVYAQTFGIPHGYGRFATEIEQYQSNFVNAFKPDMINRLLSVDSHVTITKDEALHLFSALGLYITGDTI